MPYQAIWEESGIYVSYSGQTSDEEVAQFAEQTQSNERFTDIRYVLHDFLRCTGAKYSPQRTEELAAIDSAASVSNQRIKIAVVTDREDVIAMVNVYLGAGFSGFVLQVFTSVSQANTWLNRKSNQQA